MAPPTFKQMLAEQASLKSQFDLKRVPARRRDTYKPRPVAAYGHALNRYNINPTMPGPFYRRNDIVQEVKEAALEELTGKRYEVYVKSGRTRSIHGPLYMRKGALSGSTGTHTGASGASGAAAEQDGLVPTEVQQYDSMYLCDVAIGTAGQTVALDFDTGSSDLWVFSTSLPANMQSGHTCFNPSKSSTWQTMSGYTWSITYGDQSSASGTCGKDTLDLGGLKVENQCIELATKLSSSFQRDPGDGLLGLAFSTINTVKRNGRSSPQTTPVDNMISQGDIPAGAELFTSAFYSDRDAGTESFFTFGWVDEALVASSGQEVQWIEIDNSMGFWQFPSTSVQVNGKTVKLSGNTAIADTGTTLALVSDTVCEALYGAIPGATYDSSNGGWVFPLSTKASDLPTFTIACGPYYFQIQPEDFAFAPADSKNWYGGIQSRGDLDFDILGDAFLKSVYAIWDQGNVRLGLVPKIQKVQNLTPPSY